jgi:hypothetical protein
MGWGQKGEWGGIPPRRVRPEKKRFLAPGHAALLDSRIRACAEALHRQGHGERLDRARLKTANEGAFGSIPLEGDRSGKDVVGETPTTATVALPGA